jgi:hypothetical protein
MQQRARACAQRRLSRVTAHSARDGPQGVMAHSDGRRDHGTPTPRLPTASPEPEPRPVTAVRDREPWQPAVPEWRGQPRVPCGAALCCALCRALLCSLCLRCSSALPCPAGLLCPARLHLRSCFQASRLIKSRAAQTPSPSPLSNSVPPLHTTWAVRGASTHARHPSGTARSRWQRREAPLNHRLPLATPTRGVATPASLRRYDAASGRCCLPRHDSAGPAILQSQAQPGVSPGLEIGSAAGRIRCNAGAS